LAFALLTRTGGVTVPTGVATPPRCGSRRVRPARRRT
jgi:hypothetical protein